MTKILPLMTQPFDYKQRQSILPKWEELLLFNENFEEVFQTDKNKNVVIFFEIIDFLPMALANKKLNRYGQKGKQLKLCLSQPSYLSYHPLFTTIDGWYRVAWAFLKCVDNDWRSERFGQKCRLQMFKPQVKLTDSSRQSEDDVRDVWDWWRAGKRDKYPSTLWVTVQPVSPPSASQPTLRYCIDT